MAIWTPFPKQVEALSRSEFEVLFGGSRGPGKTDAGIVWLLGGGEYGGRDLVDHPRYRALILRKSYEDLSDWLDRAGRMYRSYGAEITGKPATIKFPSGAIFKVGHLKDRSSYEKYLGHEYQRILIEELTLIPKERYYVEIQGSCRSTVDDIKPQMFFTTNPGSAGHGWVKRRFVTPSPWGKPFVGDDGRSRVFIHATVDDNPMLLEKDPGYVKYLDGLKKIDYALWKAWRLGDWDSFVGQAFPEWEGHKHIVRNFARPIEQFRLKVIGFDWGYSNPGVASWIGVLPENQQGVSRAYVYRQIHQTKTNPKQWVEDIEAFTKKDPVNFMVLPHDCFSTGDEGLRVSIAEFFSEIKNGDKGGRLRIERGRTLDRGSRLNRKAILHEYLSDAPDGKPWLQFHEMCRDAIRTIPELVLDENNPEDINTESDDHDYDAITLALMTIGLQPGQSGSLEQLKKKKEHPFTATESGEYKEQDYWEQFKVPNKKPVNPEFK